MHNLSHELAIEDAAPGHRRARLVDCGDWVHGIKVFARPYPTTEAAGKVRPATEAGRGDWR
jgi:hypothetical protein